MQGQSHAAECDERACTKANCNQNCNRRGVVMILILLWLSLSMRTLATVADEGRCRWSRVGWRHTWAMTGVLAAARVAARGPLVRRKPAPGPLLYGPKGTVIFA